MSNKNKPDGQWDSFGGSAMARAEEPNDPIKVEIDKCEQMKKEGATVEALAAQEKKIWDMIYRKNMAKLMA